MRRSSRVTAIALSALTGAVGLASIASVASAGGSTGPLHGRLVFGVCPPIGQGGLCSLATADDTGTNFAALVLSGTVTAGSHVVFSHDGRHIAFIGELNGGVAVVVANADGSGSHVVMPGPLVDATHIAGRVVWSADDKTLYLATLAGAGIPLPLWQVNVDGTGLQQVPGLPADQDELQPEVLADGRLAYSDGSNNVVVFDTKTRTSTTVYTKLSGTLPYSLSPDGKRIAVVEVPQPTSTTMVIAVYNIDGTGRQPITTIAPTDYQAMPMTWSPDSAELAFDGDGGPITVHDMTGSGRPDVVITAPAGSPVGMSVGDASWIAIAGSQPGPIPTPTPTPSPSPNPGGGALGQPTVHRIGGSNRYETGRLVSQAQWPAGQAAAVVLARGDAAPDALAGVPLSAHVHGPLLLTDPAALDTATSTEIDRVLGGPQSHKTVYILGGKNAVAPAIENGLRAAGYTVIRYGGISRYDTALQIATAFGATSHVIVATGQNFPDALSAGPLGAAENAPIVLSDDAVLDPATAAFIVQHQAIDPVGGQAQKAVATLNTGSKAVDAGLAGSDRYTTSANVANRIAQILGHAPATVGMSSGLTFPDALTGGAYVANGGGALLLTNPTVLSGPAATTLSGWRTQLSAVEIFGGTAAVSDQTGSSILVTVNGRAV